jgi:hypothetical protein
MRGSPREAGGTARGFPLRLAGLVARAFWLRAVVDALLLGLPVQFRMQVLALDFVLLLLHGLVAVALHPRVVADGFHTP